MTTLSLFRSTDGTRHDVTDPFRAMLMRQVIKAMVAQQMFCPITREILDARKCAVLYLGEDAETADPRLVISLEAFRRILAASAEDRAKDPAAPWITMAETGWVRLPTGLRKSERPIPPAAPATSAEDVPTLF